MLHEEENARIQEAFLSLNPTSNVVLDNTLGWIYRKEPNGDVVFTIRHNQSYIPGQRGFVPLVHCRVQDFLIETLQDAMRIAIEFLSKWQ